MRICNVCKQRVMYVFDLWFIHRYRFCKQMDDRPLRTKCPSPALPRDNEHRVKERISTTEVASAVCGDCMM